MSRPRTFLLVTPEYPPECGGVGDYTRLVALSLARAGDRVSVWTRPTGHSPLVDSDVAVNVLPDDFGPRTMRALSSEFEALPPEGVVFVQYVPQGFGWKGTNVPFASFLGARRERVWLMVHEPLYPFLSGQPLKHDVMAVATRLMLRLVTRRTEHLFVSTPAWEPYVTRYGRPRLRPEWLPIPATMHAGANAFAESGSEPSATAPTVAHFGTYGELVARPLARVLLSLCELHANLTVVLVGRGSERFQRELEANAPGVAARIRATGPAEPDAVRRELRNATVAVFPFGEGASTRRTSLMSALSVGAAIVTTDGWCCESIWRDSGAVELAPSADAEVVVRTVERLLGDPARRAVLRRRAVELYRARFDVDRVVSRLHELAPAPSSPARR